LAGEVLRDLFPQGDAIPAVTISKIQDAVSSSFGLTVAELVSPRRSQAVAYPRQVAMYLARELTDSSLPKIGKEFGGRDHTTATPATPKIPRLTPKQRSVYTPATPPPPPKKHLRETPPEPHPLPPPVGREPSAPRRAQRGNPSTHNGFLPSPPP